MASDVWQIVPSLVIEDVQPLGEADRNACVVSPRPQLRTHGAEPNDRRIARIERVGH
jgi:hypothetical protein